MSDSRSRASWVDRPPAGATPTATSTAPAGADRSRSPDAGTDPGTPGTVGSPHPPAPSAGGGSSGTTPSSGAASTPAPPTMLAVDSRQSGDLAGRTISISISIDAHGRWTPRSSTTAAITSGTLSAAQITEISTVEHSPALAAESTQTTTSKPPSSTCADIPTTVLQTGGMSFTSRCGTSMPPTASTLNGLVWKYTG